MMSCKIEKTYFLLCLLFVIVYTSLITIFKCFGNISSWNYLNIMKSIVKAEKTVLEILILIMI